MHPCNLVMCGAVQCTPSLQGLMCTHLRRCQGRDRDAGRQRASAGASARVPTVQCVDEGIHHRLLGKVACKWRTTTASGPCLASPAGDTQAYAHAMVAVAERRRPSSWLACG
eukprot:355670-Chlamydomonas_euryale.AAC.4